MLVQLYKKRSRYASHLNSGGAPASMCWDIIVETEDGERGPKFLSEPGGTV